MSLNFTNLVAQGRAKAVGVCWNEAELEALILLEKERGLTRIVAADFIRNGIMTVEDYDAAKNVNFTPKTVDEAAKDAAAALVEAGQEVVKKAKGRPKK